MATIKHTEPMKSKECIVKLFTSTMAKVIMLIMWGWHHNTIADATVPVPSLTWSQSGGSDQGVYLIRPGDVLDIKFFHNPELDQNVLVRPDGRISVPLAHEVVAMGKTPEELGRLIANAYAAELVDPNVVVIVRSVAPRKIHVGGDVENPGPIEFTGSMTTLRAILEAGGVNQEKSLENVLVIRNNPHHEPVIFQANLKVLIDGTGIDENVALLPDDVVYVPRVPLQIHVGGAVKKPGLLQYMDEMTLLEAIIASGDVEPTAYKKEIYLIRKGPNMEPVVIPINLKAITDGTDLGQDVTLIPHDIIYVPMSPIAHVNKWVDQYIRRNIPINFGIRGPAIK